MHCLEPIGNTEQIKWGFESILEPSIQNQFDTQNAAFHSLTYFHIWPLYISFPNSTILKLIGRDELINESKV